MNKSKIKKYVKAYRDAARKEGEDVWEQFSDRSAFRLKVVGQVVAVIIKDKEGEGYTTTIPGMMTQQNKTLKDAMGDCRHAVSAWLFVCNECATRNSKKG